MARVLVAGVLLAVASAAASVRAEDGAPARELGRMRELYASAGRAPLVARPEDLPSARLARMGASALPDVLEAVEDRTAPGEMREDLVRDVLGSTDDPRSLDALAVLAADERERLGLRRRALAELGELGGEEALDRLMSLARDLPADDPLSTDVCRALGAAGDPAAAPDLAARMDSKDEGVRLAAARGLAAVARKTRDPSYAAPILAALDDRGARSRAALIELVGETDDVEASPALRDLARDESEPADVRRAAGSALRRLGR